MTSPRLVGLIVPLLLWAAPTQAQTAAPEAALEARPALSFGSGKLLLTGGVSSIDGAAGGGLTPWAVTSSYASEGEVGGTAFFTRTKTQDYALNVYGAAIGFSDRFELSLARQEFNASVVVPDTTLKLDIVGLKARIAGDAVLDADTLMPQIALGAQFKRLAPGPAVGGVLDSVSARRNGVDFYLSATKLFLAQGILVNGTLRATKANQNGLLGFGSADKKSYSVKPEFSLALLLSKNIAVGAEYRFKPNNLAFAGAAFEEQAWKDLFIAWAPSKNVSVTAAYVDLGNIVGHTRQTGGYVSAQLAF
ncbi:MAG: DUF3034 family protein [Burkholderiales bacterium]|nr:DUF3034 family protein [Burkholderiales bacterium]